SSPRAGEAARHHVPPQISIGVTLTPKSESLLTYEIQPVSVKVVAFSESSVSVESTRTPPEIGTFGAGQSMGTPVWPPPISVAKPKIVTWPLSLAQMANAVRLALVALVLLPETSQVNGPGNELESTSPVPPAFQTPPPPIVRVRFGHAAKAAPLFPGWTSVVPACPTTCALRCIP